MRQGLGASTCAAAVLMAMVSFAAEASPLSTERALFDSVSSRSTLLHRVLIYAKEGNRKLVDGRWNLGRSEAQLGLSFSDDEKTQLMACTGRIVCYHGRREVFGSAASVLRPDMLVTAKHVFSSGRNAKVAPGHCSFRSFLHRNIAIPIQIEQDQRKSYFLNNEDFIVVRLKRELNGCKGFAVHDDTFLAEGEQIFSATGYQRNSLNRLSLREPVVAKGAIRSVSTGFWGGPPFYYAEIDLDEGGSGGAVFALRNGRPVTDSAGRIVLRGVLVAVGPKGRNGQPYSEDRNYTIIVGLQDEFRDLVMGKANRLVPVEQTQCLDDGPAKIDVIAEPIPVPQSDLITPLVEQDACGGETTDNCAKLAKKLKDLEKGIETLAAASASSPRGKEKRQFKLKNDTSCPVCFTFNRCNEYGCWDEVVRASAKSTLFAGIGTRPPEIRNPQFCMSGQLLADWRPPPPPRRPLPPPPLPPRKPGLTLVGLANITDAASEAQFSAAKEKAKREGVWSLTEEDVRGLSLEQISELRGY